MKKPKLKKDWEGLTVRLLRELRNNAGTIFAKGLEMHVDRNWAGLHLNYVKACRECRLRHICRISNVRERDVEIIQ